jgi:hypothetical protein
VKYELPIGAFPKADYLMPLFHTTLFSNDPPGDAFALAGAAWSFERESGVYHGPPNKMHERSAELFKERGHAPTGNYFSDDVPVFFDMEILIRAAKPAQARQALNLLISSMGVLEGSITFCPEPLSIEPRETGTAPPPKPYMSKTGLFDACKLANRVSRARSLGYALHKLALSYQSSSPHMMDLIRANRRDYSVSRPTQFITSISPMRLRLPIQQSRNWGSRFAQAKRIHRKCLTEPGTPQ